MRHAAENGEKMGMDETRQYDVALAECRSYEDETVETALRAALQAINGLDFVKPGMRIAVKTNLVTAMKPETAAAVHPAAQDRRRRSARGAAGIPGRVGSGCG